METPLTKAEEEQVWRTLELLLHSAPLRATSQCQHLLKYIVEHTLQGDATQLRERVIGKTVFGRPTDYDPSEDPVVRIRAADLRKRLALYYQSLEENPALRIDVPSGSYKATFVWSRRQDMPDVVSAPALTVPQSSAVLAAPVDVPAPVPAVAPVVEQFAPKVRVRRSGRQRAALLLVLMIVLLVAVGFAFGLYRRLNDPLRQFWGPMFADPKPVLISIGSNAVYRVAEQSIDEYLAQHPAGQGGMEIFPAFRPDQSYGSTGLQAAPDSFVALGDVAAAQALTRTFTQYGKTSEERFPNDISFAEVREHPTVLIGGSNNPTALEMTRNMPIQRTGRNSIADRDHPDKHWDLHASSDSHDTEDYAIITRLPGTKDTSPMVSVAGLGGYGTLAATEFLCGGDNVLALRRALGSDWLTRNFQVLLRIRIKDFKPVTTEIVDLRSW